MYEIQRQRLSRIRNICEKKQIVGGNLNRGFIVEHTSKTVYCYLFKGIPILQKRYIIQTWLHVSRRLLDFCEIFYQSLKEISMILLQESIDL